MHNASTITTPETISLYATFMQNRIDNLSIKMNTAKMIKT